MRLLGETESAPHPAGQGHEHSSRIQHDQSTLAQTASTYRRPRSSPSPNNGTLLCVHTFFVLVNLSIIGLIVYGWRFYRVYYEKHTTHNLYGQSTGLMCASRMLGWMEALLGLIVATKLAVLFMQLSDFLEKRSSRRSKWLEWMIFTALVLRTMTPFGFGFKLFWHLCGSVVLADARSCRSTWMQSPLPSDAFKAKEMQSLRSADGQLIDSLETVWLCILSSYLAAVLIFLFGVVLCSPNDSLDATAHIQALASETALNSLQNTNAPTDLAGIHTRENSTTLGEDTHLGRLRSWNNRTIFFPDSAAWTSEHPPRYVGVRARTAETSRNFTNADFEELPACQYKALTIHTAQSSSVPNLLSSHVKKQQCTSPSETSADHIVELAEFSRKSPTVLGSSHSEAAEPHESQIVLSTQAPSGDLNQSASINNAYFSEQPHHDAANTYQGISIDTDEAIGRDEVASHISPSENSRISSACDLAPSIQSEASPQRNSEYAATFPGSVPPQEATYCVYPNLDFSQSLVPIISQERQLQLLFNDNTWEGRHLRAIHVGIHPNIKAYPFVYIILLCLHYIVVTITDVRTPPDCCMQSSIYTDRDDFLEMGVLNLVLCCQDASGTSLCCCWCCHYLKSLFSPHSPDNSQQRSMQKRRLTKAEKAKLVANLVTRPAVESVCCICFMDYKPADLLVFVPCPSRHYFHRNCSQTWLKRHTTCPLCRANLLEGLNGLRESAREIHQTDTRQEIT